MYVQYVCLPTLHKVSTDVFLHTLHKVKYRAHCVATKRGYLGSKKMCIGELWNGTSYDTGGEDVTQTLNNIESMSKD